MRVHSAYLVAQARELLRELGSRARQGIDAQSSPRELLNALHSIADDPAADQTRRLVARAEAALLAGRTGFAEGRFHQVTQQSDASPAIQGIAFDRLGDLRLSRRDFEGAANAYKEALRLRPNDARTQKDLARALWHLGDPNPAAGQFGPATERVNAPPGSVLGSPREDVIEVCGLYVNELGAGVLLLQGCPDPGGQGLVATGSLGIIAKESCDLAWALWRRRTGGSLPSIRIHAAQAGRLKEGPSLGLPVYALIGAVLGALRVTLNLAFTGELDLKGRIHPVGGVREKALAAYMSGARQFFLPGGNLSEVETSFRDILTLQPIVHVSQLEEELALQ